MALGKKLRRVRESHRMSQRELARRAGLPYNYVARIEAGRIASPTVATRRKLAKALGAEITELLD